jgi:hypothetical protein
MVSTRGSHFLCCVSSLLALCVVALLGSGCEKPEERVGAYSSTREAGAGTGGRESDIVDEEVVATAGAGGGAAEGPDREPVALPIDTMCTASSAFAAAGASFVYPTPQALADVLNALTYEPTTQPLTVVLQADDDGESSLALSMTEEGADGKQSFPADARPVLIRAQRFQGGFRSAEPQEQAWLRVADPQASYGIELQNVEVSATTDNGCATLNAVVTATVPLSALDIEVTSGAAKVRLADLVSPGDSDKAPSSVELRLMLTAATVDFDFEALDAL